MPTPSSTSIRTASSSSAFYGKPKEGKGKEEATKKGGMASKDEDGFLDPEECLMIFGGSDAIHSKHQHKVRY